MIFNIQEFGEREKKIEKEKRYIYQRKNMNLCPHHQNGISIRETNRGNDVSPPLKSSFK
jgi:hypothetical protein|tara:strand:+ start:374 stop:550 length:177 start_codon:yes stop_codon:yes gene_type:complete